MNTSENTVKPVILYIDDDEACLEAFQATFRHQYTVLTCTSQGEALKLLQANPVDLLMVDQRMPEQSGIEFLQTLSEDYDHIVKMVLTGYTDIDAIINSINSGKIVRYITKPWSESDVRQTIEAALKIRLQEQENDQLFANIQREILNQKFLIEILQKYVPKQVIEHTLHPEKSAKNPGEIVQRVTVLFADIRDFTGYSSMKTPEEVVDVLNQYFSIMGNCVVKHYGIIDKFLGDGLLAIFGAFDSKQSNDLNALNCALDMLEALKEFNASFDPNKEHAFRIGIGIHSGPAILAHLGSENRSTFTAVGPTVEAAFDLEKLTHATSNTILISKSVYEVVKDAARFEEWDAETDSASKDELRSIYRCVGP